MNIESAGEQLLHSHKPDFCEIRPTPYRDCTQLPTYERMDRWVDGVIMWHLINPDVHIWSSNTEQIRLRFEPATFCLLYRVHCAIPHTKFKFPL